MWWSIQALLYTDRLFPIGCMWNNSTKARPCVCLLVLKDTWKQPPLKVNTMEMILLPKLEIPFTMQQELFGERVLFFTLLFLCFFSQRHNLDQIRVFETFLFACLPLIYSSTWNDHKARVLADWGKKELRPYVVVSMARRNGKTFVTSGAVVALLLCIPNVKIVIFSTCKRTSQLMMSAVSDMLDLAFEKGTHCNRQEYQQISKNTETIVFEAFGTKRTVACLPGKMSMCVFCVRVLKYFFFFKKGL